MIFLMVIIQGLFLLGKVLFKVSLPGVYYKLCGRTINVLSIE